MKLRFLRRNLKIRNMKTKESAYKPLVHPTLEYPGLILLGTHILQITSTQQRKYYIKPQDGLQTDPIKPVSTPSSTHWTGPHSSIKSPTLDVLQISQIERGIERTTPAATTSRPVGYSTNICHSSRGSYLNGTACPWR